MTPTYYYDSKANKFYGPVDRMPPEREYKGHPESCHCTLCLAHNEKVRGFNIYLSTLQPITHTFTGHSRIVPEGEIEWRYEVAWRNPDGTITGWKECEDMFHYEQQPYQYRRRVATPKITAQPDKPAIDRLIDKMDEGDVKITFGLQEHHIKRINEQAKKWGENKHLAVYSTHFWDNLAKEFAWEPFTLALYYFNHTNNQPSPQTGEKESVYTSEVNDKALSFVDTFCRPVYFQSEAYHKAAFVGYATGYVTAMKDHQPPAAQTGEKEHRIIIEGNWYPAECNSCGWIGSSQYLEGCHAIADTGDHSDPLCPICGSKDIDSTEELHDLQSLVSKLGKAHVVAKYFRDNYERVAEELYLAQLQPPAAKSDQEAAEKGAISEWGNEDYHEDERRNYENGFTDGCNHVRGQQPVDAVAFAEWIRVNEWEPAPNEFNCWYRRINGTNTERLTTADLYALFTARYPTPKQGSHDTEGKEGAGC